MAGLRESWEIIGRRSRRYYSKKVKGVNAFSKLFYRLFPSRERLGY